jgi:hypothetical protein
MSRIDWFSDDRRFLFDLEWVAIRHYLKIEALSSPGNITVAILSQFHGDLVKVPNLCAKPSFYVVDAWHDQCYSVQRIVGYK